MAIRVIIVRHGESTYNVEGRVQGHCDKSRLTPKGEAMASSVGVALKNIPIDVIYSSPLNRAHRTAELATAELGLSLPSYCQQTN